MHFVINYFIYFDMSAIIDFIFNWYFVVFSKKLLIQYIFYPNLNHWSIAVAVWIFNVTKVGHSSACFSI